MERTKKSKKKREYSKNPLEKIAKGEPWAITLEIDHDVAPNLFAEKEKTGASYWHIINASLRKTLKPKK